MMCMTPHHRSGRGRTIADRQVEILVAAMCLFLLCCCCCITQAHADISDNPCTSKWSGPDRHNSLDCDDWQGWLISRTVPIAIPLVLSLLFFLPGCCVLLCGRYLCNCFGSSKLRPGHCCCGGAELDRLPEPERIMMYDRCGIRTVKGLAVLSALLGLVIIIVSFVGGSKVASTAKNAADGVGDGVDFMLDLVNQTLDGIRDPTDGSYPDGFSQADFDSVTNSLQDLNRDVKKEVHTYDSYLQSYSIIPAYVAALPAFLMAFPLLFAICNVRTCGPLSIVCCSFSIQFIYMLVATIFALMLLPIDLICGEIHSQLDGEAGVFQWHVVPECEYQSPFKDVLDSIDKMELEASNDACRALLLFCSDSPTYNSGDSERIFSCNLTSPAECGDLHTVQGTMYEMLLKTGAPETCEGNPSLCTVSYCADHCDSSDAKTASTDAIKFLNIGIRVLDVFERVIRPWLDCNKLINKALESGPEQICDGIGGGLRMICAGSYMSAFGLIFCVVVCFLGQKRFVSQDDALKKIDTSSSIEMGAYNQNPSSQSQQNNNSSSNNNDTTNNDMSVPFGVPLQYNDAPSTTASPMLPNREDTGGGFSAAMVGGYSAPMKPHPDPIYSNPNSSSPPPSDSFKSHQEPEAKQQPAPLPQQDDVGEAVAHLSRQSSSDDFL